ncbi:MAG: hypothetical protein F6J98_34755 [Moorea sp. SIO4G2]|uniref:hypothetical protein n=1 Tax=unclassified Moorena TaxID=2683338 RepID=UPI0013F6FFCD|nr:MULTISPECIES: hypothetical protein [unclassified Moorena]NEO17376.1 hypothetical protein [Moorena sp. SIO3E8]NEO65278.1 hypothetical protein [Moorena sp. SIO4G2]NEQ03511.1 hypothetical protein [Moorena sp. SIO3F7]
MKCDQIYCPWIQDSQNADHYVCLKCNRERYINESRPGSVIFVCVAIAFIVVALLSNDGEIQHPENQHRATRIEMGRKNQVRYRDLSPTANL